MLTIAAVMLLDFPTWFTFPDVSVKNEYPDVIPD
jgi:hypothetical protein